MIYGYEQEFGRDIFWSPRVYSWKNAKGKIKPQSESILDMFFEQRKALEIVYYCLEIYFDWDKPVNLK